MPEIQPNPSGCSGGTVCYWCSSEFEDGDVAILCSRGTATTSPKSGRVFISVDHAEDKFVHDYCFADFMMEALAE